jgi:hypothetical protein
MTGEPRRCSRCQEQQNQPERAVEEPPLFRQLAARP